MPIGNDQTFEIRPLKPHELAVMLSGDRVTVKHTPHTSVRLAIDMNDPEAIEVLADGFTEAAILCHRRAARARQRQDLPERDP